MHEQTELLKDKRISYDDGDAFILDCPDYDAMFDRFRSKGALADWEIEQALDNTLILNDVDEIYLDKEIKMPMFHPEEE